ncbi:MAG TPA: sulfotransferase [Solirubrobacteraceae bacterium]|jgi:hypothetical protein|nr:sulfotransferase [Solirubrobacteraceae bacterium]
MTGSTEQAPDFFIVGQAKAGTTALYEMLRRHPQIFMPASKEPWFLADELLERTPPRPEGTPRTLEEYLSWFAPAEPGQRRGEASALYLWSRTAAGHIAELRPDARIIAILREPASLLRSLHLQFVQTHVETEHDLGKALALEPARREGRQIPSHTYWPKALLYSEHVRYVEQLRRYRELLGAERMLVLLYDDFRRDNEAVVREVLRFLEVEERFEPEELQANPTVQARSRALSELVHAVSVGRGPVSVAVKEAIKSVTPKPLRERALATVKRRLLYTDPAPPDELLTAELRRRYEPEVRALSEYLGRDLVALWGYDRVP